MMRTLKILGFLLTYPNEQHVAALKELRALLQEEKILSEKSLLGIDGFFDRLEKENLLNIQEEYVSLFDRTPSLSLHLFEHIHGDSRDRGQALVDLANVYQQTGLVIDAEETPDYLPLFLEYVSSLSYQEAQENLSSVVNITAAIGERLKNRNSDYATIFSALSDVVSCDVSPKVIEEALSKASGEAYSFEEVDKEWEEQFAFDNSKLSGASQMDSCPMAADMLARMNLTTTDNRG